MGNVEPYRELVRRLGMASVLLLFVVLIGTGGYVLLGGGRWNWSASLYMTVITLSTVGFGEVLMEMDKVPFSREWTICLIVLGSGTLLYFISTFTAFFIEGDIQGAIRRRRMQKEIKKLRDHIILVGAGATGFHVVEELLATKTPFVVIEEDSERLSRVAEEAGPGLLYILGEATEDNVLQQAGIAEAAGLISTLREDRDNLFVTVTARALNPELRIVAKVTEDTAKAKMLRAGADCTVSPSYIGGMRMVSQMIRPKVVQFLDQMLYDRKQHVRIEEVAIPAGSSLAGSALQNCSIQQYTNVLVLAVRHPDGSYRYNPGPDFVMAEDMILVVLAETDDVVRLREGIRNGLIGRV